MNNQQIKNNSTTHVDSSFDQYLLEVDSTDPEELAPLMDRNFHVLGNGHILFARSRFIYRTVHYTNYFAFRHDRTAYTLHDYFQWKTGDLYVRL